MCLWPFFENNRILFRYTDNPSELCSRKNEGL